MLAWLVVAGCAEHRPAPARLDALSPGERIGYLREAAVWSPIDTASLDLARGPADRAPGEVIECDFTLPERQLEGRMAKFLCRTSDGVVHKIKYGSEDPEVLAEVIGSRLLWALGFATDRVDPVVVLCRGCPADPWRDSQEAALKQRAAQPADGKREFEPATEETYYGRPMGSKPEQGVSWADLLTEYSASPERAGEQRVERNALALLAGFLQHADSRPAQQELACPPEAIARDAWGDEICRAPEALIADLGGILGDGWWLRRHGTSKVEYARWKATTVWRDPAACVVAVNGRPNASLHDMRISEPARRFLAARLARLRREQLHDLFSAARVELRGEEIETSQGKRRVGADDWVELFMEKEAQITTHHCPEGGG